PDIEKLARLANDEKTESRVRILAYNKLMLLGQAAEEKILLGVIIEVGLDGGLDTLAAYQDGTARDINQSEKMIVWETKTKDSEGIIQQLFRDSQVVVNRIGAWTDPRLAPPKKGEVRLNFLVSDGLYFGQGPFSVLQKDAMGGPVINSATALMMFLVNQG